PVNNAVTCEFHIIQPVVLYHINLSSGPTSKCSTELFTLSNNVPPCPCTIGFGMPVVPEEYTTHNGWSKGTCVKVVLASRRNNVSQGTLSSNVLFSFKYGNKTVCSKVGKRFCISAKTERREKSLPP